MIENNLKCCAFADNNIPCEEEEDDDEEEESKLEQGKWSMVTLFKKSPHLPGGKTTT